MTQTLISSESRSNVTADSSAVGQHKKRDRAATLIAAALVAFVVWLVGVPVLGLDLAVGSGPTAQTIGPVMVVIVPLVAGGAAWALLALFERLFRRGALAWQITGWVVLALSLLGPVSMAGSAGVLATLLAMHISVGSILILGLARVARRHTRREADAH